MWIIMLGVWTTLPVDFAIPVAPAETLRVRREGAGAPIVLLPGLLGGRFGFRKVTPRLHEMGFETIVVEPLGVGNSSRPPAADYSFAAQAARVASVLDSLDVPGAIVIAHSLGASIAFRLAVARPDLVGGIVSLEGGIAESAATPSLKRAVRLAPLLKLAGGRGQVRGLLQRQMMESSGDRSWITEAVVEAYTAPAADDLDGTLGVYRAMLASREPTSATAVLAAVRCPVVLLLGGARHVGAPLPEEIERLERGLPGLRTETLPGAGHYLHEERPAVVADVAAQLRLDGRLTAQADTVGAR
jgi:pimeloyl-ACP methyl ester carboxylesterase